MIGQPGTAVYHAATNRRGTIAPTSPLVATRLTLVDFGNGHFAEVPDVELTVLTDWGKVGQWACTTVLGVGMGLHVYHDSKPPTTAGTVFSQQGRQVVVMGQERHQSSPHGPESHPARALDQGTNLYYTEVRSGGPSPQFA